MRPLSPRLTYANIISTLALFMALTGSAVAAGVPGMITGDEIQDGTITSRDVENYSLHAYDLGVGARRLVSTRTGAPPILDYQDLAPIVRRTLDYKGFYIVFTEFRAKNAGANDAYLDCGYTIGDSTAGAAGVQVAAGQVGRGISVTVVPAHTPGQRLRFACRDGGSTTWNLSRITLTTFRLGY